MNINVKNVKIVVNVPIEGVQAVRNEIFKSGAGIIGKYTHCSNSIKCLGTFKPSNDAKPYIGEKNKLVFVEEERIEVLCDVTIAKKVIKRIRDIHPYEEPEINIIPLIDENDLK